jgi:hypothetical protein
MKRAAGSAIVVGIVNARLIENEALIKRLVFDK